MSERHKGRGEVMVISEHTGKLWLTMYGERGLKSHLMGVVKM